MNFIKATDTYCSIENNVPAPILRKGFSIENIHQKALLRICVTGFYHLYINGEKITKGELAPYINNPDHILYCDEYDVTHLLKNGKNAIAVILGNGFANQDVDSWDFSKASFRAPLCMALEIICDGKKILESDETFKTHPSPILFDMYRYGIIYDAREEIDGFSKADFDDSNWQNAKTAIPPKGKIKLCEALPVKPQYELSPLHIEKQQNFHYLISDEGKPVECTYVNEGWLYDFGFNCAGVCRLKIKGEKGQKVTIRHCEALKDGYFNINSIFTIKEGLEQYIHLLQADTYILKGGEEEIFTPVFTYHGFRYVLVEGITKEQATEDLLTYIVMNTDIKKRTDFSCSDKTLNKLYEMGIRSDLSNFHHFPTDCPHREKNGWTGDISVSAHQLLLNFNCEKSLDVWLENVRYAQRESGELPGIVPTSGWGYEWGNGPVWDSAIVNVPYYAFKYNGSTEIIRKNAPMIKKYLEYIACKRDERGLIACGLGDWVQPDAYTAGIKAPLEFTDSAQILEAARKSALLFDTIGMCEERDFALNLEAEMRDAIRKSLIDFKAMTVTGNCQTSQAYAIALDIFNEDEKKKAYKRLLDFIKEYDDHAYCGMIGLRYIFHVLFENGDADLAIKMITREDSPSYGNMLALGGTALFEATQQNGVQQSQNHHFFGDILNLFITKLAGIRINPAMNDTNNVTISPIIPKAIEHAFASFKDISVLWKKNNGKVDVKIYMPKNFHGKFEFKGKVVQLKTGENTIKGL